MESNGYAVISSTGHLTIEEKTLRDAAQYAVEFAYELGNNYDVVVDIGHTELESDHARHTGEQLGPCFIQTAAAISVGVMRRALALAELHDPELAAELRASLVVP